MADGGHVALTAERPDRTLLPRAPGSGQDGAVRPDPSSRRGELAGGAIAALAVVLLGAPVGLLWTLVAPHAQVVLRADGPSLVDPESNAFVTADLVFLLLALVAGALCGLVAWLVPARLGARPGPGVVLGLAVGGLAAGYVAARTGQLVGADRFLAALRDSGARGLIRANVRLRAVEAIAFWPVGALSVLAVLTGLRREPPGPAADAPGAPRASAADPAAAPSPSRPEYRGPA